MRYLSDLPRWEDELFGKSKLSTDLYVKSFSICSFIFWFEKLSLVMRKYRSLYDILVSLARSRLGNPLLSALCLLNYVNLLFISYIGLMGIVLAAPSGGL